MNDKQFTKVLMVAMEYYDPNSTGKARYMCNAIARANVSGKLSYWDSIDARNKIAELIHPYHYLESHLKSKLGRKLEREDFLNFWSQYL